jgi:UDP-N-acetylmuramyl pentapeptide phosphotransferase/UDP-N-acetylglucosamine-1-phosphate transferase
MVSLAQPLPTLLLLLAAGAGVAAAYGLCVALDWRTPNWQGRAIPSSVGLGFLSAVWAGFLLLWATDAAAPRWLLPAVVTSFAVLGLLDDRLGSREFSGLKGHVRALLHGKLTTGAIKLLGGTGVALTAGLVLYRQEPVRGIVAGALIALSANLVNLLDCRPSRALKGFWLLSALMVAAGSVPPPLTALLVVSLVYAPLDFRCRAMMGDAGSNQLGAALGLCWAANASLPAQLAILALLITFHAFTERYSLTKLIESTRLLRWVDQLGVPQPPPA